MIDGLHNIVAQLQVKQLILFNPTELFERINRLAWYEDTLHQWADDQEIPAEAKVLEGGCATGSLTSYIEKAGHFVTGVDRSRKMIERAKTRYTGINYRVADVLDLPFESNSFDAVIATSLINIVDNKSQALKELTRVCKKGGKISILVPLQSFSDNDLISLQQVIGGAGFSAAAMRAWHRHAPKMKTKNIETLFFQSGLAEMTTKTYLQGLVSSASAIKIR